MNNINKILEEFDNEFYIDIGEISNDIKSFIALSFTTLLTETLREIVPEEKEAIEGVCDCESDSARAWNSAIQQIKDNAKKLNIEI